MTDTAVIKALECCSEHVRNCAECPLNVTSLDHCSTRLAQNVLNLINRQKAEIERLKGEVAKEFICFVGNPHKVERCPYLEELPKVKAEAIKYFAEIIVSDYPEMEYYLAQIVKEMIGEQ